MTSPETVSVVIPTYNRAEVLGTAIESVLNQTYDDIELIVVDDASTDDTEAVATSFEAVDYRQQETNGGANAARNKGIRAASGEFVAFLDADDYWRREKVERQVEALRSAPRSCGLVYTGIEIRDFDGECVDKLSAAHPKNSKRRLLLGNYVGTFSTVLVRSSVFEDAGLLNESLPSWQDWEFYLRVADDYSFQGIDELLTVKRTGKDDQISRNIDPLLETTYPFFDSLIQREADAFGELLQRQARARLRMEVGDSAMLNGNASVARRFFVSALARYPFEPKLYVYLLLSVLGTRAYDSVVALRRRVTT